QLFEKRWLMRIFVLGVLLPQIANQAGWFTAETGRQPWVVYGLLRTSDALSKSVTAHQILFSLILFTVVYFFLFALFIYLLNKKIVQGPFSQVQDIHSPRLEEMSENFKSIQ
ncbi:MAG: cytochrome ubiquinol oxidase subunit I, partial [Bacteroidetes bacterium]